MTLDEPVAAFLAFKPDAGSSSESVTDRRRSILAASDVLFRRFGEPAPDGADVTDHEVSTPTGPIRVRVYRPRSAAAPLPVHLFIHGGGFWLGSIDELVVDATCRERSLLADCLVIAVDYRLAPEHPFPVPVEDCYLALLWAQANVGDSVAIPASSPSAAYPPGPTWRPQWCWQPGTAVARSSHSNCSKCPAWI